LSVAPHHSEAAIPTERKTTGRRDKSKIKINKGKRRRKEFNKPKELCLKKIGNND
jgi:hypothetical protein